MKFVHIADMHFDSPFSSLAKKGNLADIRRLEQRDVFRKIIDYIISHDVDYLFIAGDLYENDYVSLSTIEFINDEFKRIPNTKIFITPGNHDPYIKNSYYERYKFENNVYIFDKEEVTIIEDENANIYGMAFRDYYLNDSVLDNIQVIRNGLPNILIAHCDLDGVKDRFGYSYNPVLESTIEKYHFDYAAIGHIHKRYISKMNIVYPGSTISGGFDELGPHGMIAGEIIGTKTRFDFIKLDPREFVEKEFDIGNINSQDELIEKLFKLNLDENNLYKIVLVGNKNFDIDISVVSSLLSNTNILKIKDLSQIEYDIESLMLQNSLKGVFVRKLVEKYRMGECTKAEFEKALEIGLSSM